MRRCYSRATVARPPTFATFARNKPDKYHVRSNMLRVPRGNNKPDKVKKYPSILSLAEEPRERKSRIFLSGARRGGDAGRPSLLQLVRSRARKHTFFYTLRNYVQSIERKRRRTRDRENGHGRTILFFSVHRETFVSVAIASISPRATRESTRPPKN